MKNLLLILQVATVAFLCAGCEEREWNNPFDADCPKETWTPMNFNVNQDGEALFLTWNQPNQNISGFRIKKTVGSQQWDFSVGAKATSWIDASLVDGEEHIYELRAYAGSNMSNAVTRSSSPVLKRGTFTDARDGAIYNWVRIGDQKWMAENLKYRLSHYNLTPAAINGSANSNNQLLPGRILVYQTSDGRSGKLQVVEYGYNLKIRWITYNFDGSIYSSGENLVIRGTYSCDLDLGKESGAKTDFWWAINNDVERFLTPQNNAVFSLYTESNNFNNAVVNNGIYVYENNSALLETYGLLYNWYLVNSGTICPQGWHIPSDTEWKKLEKFLGMSDADADKENAWRGAGTGGKLKETGTAHWADQNVASNSSEFTALPGGYFQCASQSYSYSVLRTFGFFWCSPTSPDLAYARVLYNSSDQVFRYNYKDYKTVGMSVRCVCN